MTRESLMSFRIRSYGLAIGQLPMSRTCSTGDLAFDRAQAKWTEPPHQSYGLGIHFEGPGEHVCNCGYAFDVPVVAEVAFHLFKEMAINAGYAAMQFNYVASSNEAAIRLWQKLGFNIASPFVTRSKV